MDGAPDRRLAGADGDVTPIRDLPAGQCVIAAQLTQVDADDRLHVRRAQTTACVAGGEVDCTDP